MDDRQQLLSDSSPAPGASRRCGAGSLALFLLLAGVGSAVLLRHQATASRAEVSFAKKWQWDEDLRANVQKMLHNAANAAVNMGIEGGQTGAPAAKINTTAASAKNLVEELLSQKRLTTEVPIKPIEGGMIAAGRLHDLYLEDADVGPTTRLEFDADKHEVRFVVANVSVHVRTKYELRLTSMGFGESGEVIARLHGGGMTLRFPESGYGDGGCDFGAGLDLEVNKATSTRSAINVAIDQILRGNLVGIRTEVVRGMEDGLCRALLEDNEVNYAMLGSGPVPLGKELAKPSSHIWPWLLASIGVVMAMLVCCFWIGWLSGSKGCCCSGPAKSTRSTQLEDDEDEDEESGSDGSKSPDTNRALSQKSTATLSTQATLPTATLSIASGQSPIRSIVTSSAPIAARPVAQAPNSAAMQIARGFPAPAPKLQSLGPNGFVFK